MKSTAIFIFFILLIATTCTAQAPPIKWKKCLGGSTTDGATSIQQTTDGGYIVAGYAASNDGDVSGNQGNYDVWVVKINAAGSVQWQKCLGGSNAEFAYSIQQTADGGYIVAGWTDSNNDGNVSGYHGSYDCWVIKLNATGNIQWQKCLGGSDAEQAFSIQQTADGGYIVAGFTYSRGYGNFPDGDVSGNHGDSDAWIVKLNAAGGIQWQKCLGGSNEDGANFIQQTTDGGYIVAGFTLSSNGDVSGNHGSYDAWLVKLNATGSIQWQKCLGGSGEDEATSVQQTVDGGYIVAGFTYSTNGDVSGNHGTDDAWIVKLNATGSVQWQKCIGGSDYDFADFIQQTADSGYIVAGGSVSNDGDVSGSHGEGDAWIIKLSATGNIQWQKCLGGSDDEEAFSIQQTADGGYIVAGSTGSTNGDVSGNHGNYDAWIVKLGAIKAELKWDKSFAEQTTAPKGVAADGVARLYLKVSKADSSSTSIIFQKVVVSLKDSFNTTGTTMLGKVQRATTLTTYSTEANTASSTADSSTTAQSDSIYFWYVAPDDFSNTAGSRFADSSEREVQAHIVVTYTNGSVDSTDLPIKIVRPPLLLVHGLADGENAWKNLNYGSGTLFTASPLFKQKKAVNLLPHAYYDVNANLLLSPDGNAYTQNTSRLNTLQGNIEALRQQGYACNQVDYVCHSMGGCILRTAITLKANAFYGLDNTPYKNYEKGFVHKAITLNTPHQGSPVADAVTEFVPQAPSYINLALGIIYNHFPNAPMIFDFIQPQNPAQPYGTWQATPAVRDLQVSTAAGGVHLAATPVINHLIAGDVDIYDVHTAATLADLDKYVELMDRVLKVMRAVTPPGPAKNFLTGLMALEKTARVFTFIEWYSQQKGFPNFLGDGDLVVPLASGLAGQSVGTMNTTVFHNSGSILPDANHISLKNRTDVGNQVKNLLNSAVGSNVFSNTIPATPPSLGSRMPISSLNQQEANRTETSSYDTTKIKIIAPASNSTLSADSTRTIQVRLKDTVDLVYIDLAFQGKSFVSVSRAATQSFTIKIDSAFLGSQSISATAVYDRATGTDYYTDTITANVITNAVLTGFTAKADTNYLYKNQPFFPEYTAIYTNYSAGIPPNSPDLNVSVTNPARVQYNAAQHAFYAITDTGTTTAIITYKTFKDTIAFVLIPGLNSGCINRTTSNTSLRSAVNWSRSVIPTTCDSVVVMPGHILVIDSSIQIRSLYISAGATVSLADSTVRLQIGGADDGNQSFTNYGTLTVSKGKIAINGSLQLMAGSNFNMTGGELILDANTGFTQTSLPSGKNIFDVPGTMNSFSFTGGTLQIIDPPLDSSSQAIRCSYNFGDNTILKLGNGISVTASNNPNGFGGNLMPTKIGKMVLDAATANNNRIFVNPNPLTVKSSVYVKSGNLVQKAMIRVEQ